MSRPGEQAPWQREHSDWVDGWRAAVWACIDKIDQLLASSPAGYCSKVEIHDGLADVAFKPPPPAARDDLREVRR